MNRIVVGVDIAKRVFQLHWVEPDTGEIVALQLKRERFLEHFSNRSPCLIGMEACGGSQHWARSLQKLGHEVKLLSGRMVKPFVVGNKNDAADARGIWMAVQQTGIKAVAGQERGATSDIGAASDARAVGEVSHRADQWLAGIAHRVRRSDAAGSRRDQARYPRGVGSTIGSVTGDGDRDLARTVCSAGCA